VGERSHHCAIPAPPGDCFGKDVKLLPICKTRNGYDGASGNCVVGGQSGERVEFVEVIGLVEIAELIERVGLEEALELMKIMEIVELITMVYSWKRYMEQTR